VIAVEEISTLPRQPDASAFYLVCAGGLRAAEVKADLWMIEPVLHDRKPCRKGFFSRSELQDFTRKFKLRPLAFHRINWVKGEYSASWSPIISSEKTHLQGPADIWANIASNMAKRRMGDSLRHMASPSHEKVAAILDDCSVDEILSRSISLSLRNIDINIEQITEFYHENLINIMADGRISGWRFGSAQDHNLFAHVHSFFLHFGAARDYLAALIARRIGASARIEGMARLLEMLRAKHFGIDPLLDELASRNFIQPSLNNPHRWELSNWLKAASDQRNQFVHKRPFGARHVERFGVAKEIERRIGLYRYEWLALLKNNDERDVLDVVLEHYRQIVSLFWDMAKISGHDTAMQILKREDIISIKIDKR
jgi:hypothetical protein